MPETLEIRQVLEPGDPDVTRIVAQSDAYLESLYPPESNFAESAEALISDRDAAFFTGYLGNNLVACGAARLLADDGRYGEIKRVFVAESHRGRNLAGVLMRHLEDYLRSRGIGVVRIETGTKQPAALTLFRRLGYTEREAFGRYAENPLCVFFEKSLNG